MTMATPDRKTRVLIVDDSAIVRRMLANALRTEPDMEVVGLASDPFVARDLILQQQPDVVTLDIEMPRMDGLTFLRKLMVHHPLPVIIVSSVTQAGSAASIEALGAGAIDVIAKPGGPTSVGQVADRLKYRIRALRSGQPVQFARLQKAQPPGAKPNPASLTRANGLILIGASTGGTQAIETVLTRLPADTPPILIVQHMPAHFTRAFAARLDSVCPMRVVEASSDQPLRRSTAYIAPGDFHLTVQAMGVEMRAVLDAGPPVHYQRPSVDVLFETASRLRGVPIVALLLTGMGSDGREGARAIRAHGGAVIAQDESTATIYGMPAAIAEAGLANTILPLPRIASAIAAWARGEPLPAGAAAPRKSAAAAGAGPAGADLLTRSR